MLIQPDNADIVSLSSALLPYRLTFTSHTNFRNLMWMKSVEYILYLSTKNAAKCLCSIGHDLRDHGICLGLSSE